MHSWRTHRFLYHTKRIGNEEVIGFETKGGL
jgi:hypothetical protein